MKSQWLAAGKWLVLLALVVSLVAYADIPKISESLSRMGTWALSGSFALMILSRLCYAARWRLLCARLIGGRRVSLFFLFRTNLLAEFTGIAAQSSLGGEATRIWKLGSKIGRKRRAVLSVMADRALGTLTLVAMVLIFFPSAQQKILDRLVPSPRNAAIAAIAIPLGLLAAGLVLSRLGWVKRLVSALRGLELKPLEVGLPVLLSAGGHLCFSAAYFILLHYHHDLSFTAAAFVIMGAQLGRFVPLSVLGIGLSEGSMVVLFHLAGVPTEIGLLVVMGGLLIRYVMAICGLLIELAWDGKAFIRKAWRKEEALTDGLSGDGQG